MLFFYFDSNAMAKAYIQEKGSSIVDYLLKNTIVEQWYVLTLGLLETISIFVRKKNSGVISHDVFRTSLRAFRKDFFDNQGPTKIEAKDKLAITAAPLIEKHSINATDAVVLRSALDLADHERKQGNELILVTADQRLVTAAKAEGLQVINPETAALAEIEQLLHADSPAPSTGNDFPAN